MKVKAIRLGYYEHARRREGDIFHIKESEFSKNWMERIDDKKVLSKKKKDHVDAPEQEDVSDQYVI